MSCGRISQRNASTDSLHTAPPTSQRAATSTVDRGIHFWRHCAAEPHCIRLLPENQPRTRTEAMLRRIVSPGDPRAHFDHMGRYMYPTRPVAMEMDAIKKQRQRGLEIARKHTELLKSIVLKEPPRPAKPEMNLAAMKERLEQARLEHARHELQQQQTSALLATKNSEMQPDQKVCKNSK
ncbi:hypothetical protein PoB_000461900 [Plakobranchus ocellatus]|uniref:Uncharacterized protein n=1 Tax=Plakobranchus ocellatus TaxID=259542 RepID=A0AAV3Y7P4_9GAST|nr:hypothetical protein PoB_000461900 [Plakobranchus ocellatus]